MRSVDVVDKGKGVILLGVGLSFATVPIADLAFATLGLGSAVLDVLSAFAWTLTLVEVVVAGEVRSALPGMVVVLGLIISRSLPLPAIPALLKLLPS